MSQTSDWPIDVLGQRVTPELLLYYYASGCFPMGDHRDDAIAWYRPHERAIVHWADFTVPRSLRKCANQRPYRVTMNHAFSEVITACAQRDETWICRDIERLYLSLHQHGLAHSVEAWEDDELVGGCYGLALAGCFCGESMFHRAPNASKICVWNLIKVLEQEGFAFLDCQQQSPHMERFGAREIGLEEFELLLAQVLNKPGNPLGRRVLIE